MASALTPVAPWALYARLAATAFFWGATWVAGRVAVQEASPLAVASWRFLLAASVLGLLLVYRQGWPRWTRREWATVTALGATGIFLYNLCFLYGLQTIEAGRGALVVALTPAVIALADWRLFGAPLPPRKAAGIALAMLGCLLVVTNGDLAAIVRGGIGRGEWLILGCVVLWSAYTFIGRTPSARLTPLAATFGAALTGWAMLTAAALADGSLFALERLSWKGGSAIAFLGLLGTAIAFTWYAEGVHRIGATRAAIFINFVPVCAVLLGAVLLGEVLSPAVISGGALVLAGIILTNRARTHLPVPLKETTA